jgi:dolichol kinase
MVPNARALRSELARKAIHLGSSAIPLAYASGAPRNAVLLVLAALGSVALAVEVTRFRSERVRLAFVRAVGTLLREHEHRAWSGASWLLAAYVLSVLLFPRGIAVAAMLAAALGDASAAIVGRSVSAMRARAGVITPGKTLVGSVACALVTFAAAYGIAGLAPLVALAAAAAASLAERWEVRAIDDNVRVALAAGIAARIAVLVTAT